MSNIQFLFKYHDDELYVQRVRRLNNIVIDKIKFCSLKIFFVFFLKPNSF